MPPAEGARGSSAIPMAREVRPRVVLLLGPGCSAPPWTGDVFRRGELGFASVWLPLCSGEVMAATCWAMGVVAEGPWVPAEALQAGRCVLGRAWGACSSPAGRWGWVLYALGGIHE